GVGGSIGVRPSIGTHVVSAQVTDAHGEVTRAQATIRVRGPNVAPTLAITAPANGASMPAGTQTTLTASAQDDFDGDISNLVRWSSDRDGDLGTGMPKVTLHAEGAHVLTATVTDSDGAT